MFKNLPVTDPKPDAKHFIDFLMGRTRQGRVPLVEYIVDDVLMRPIVSDFWGRTWVQEGKDRTSQAAFLDNFIAFWHGWVTISCATNVRCLSRCTTRSRQTLGWLK